MKQLLYLYILFALVLSFSAAAQPVPGYQGKRNLVEYNVHANVAIDGISFFNKSFRTGGYPQQYGIEKSAFIPFNFTHTLSIERVMSRKFAMAASCSFLASKVVASFTDKEALTPAGQVLSYDFAGRKMNVFGQYFCGSFVFYGRNALAPFGKYFKLTMGYCNMTGKFVAPEQNDLSAGIRTSKEKVRTGLFGMGFNVGMNRIYKSRIVINRGMSFFLPVRGNSKLVQKGTIEDAQISLVQRLRMRDIAMVYVGIGYLF